MFLAALGNKGVKLAFEWVAAFGMEGITTEMDFSGKSLKSLMKRADRLGARHVLIVGDNEIEQGTILLRNMKTKKQVKLPIDGIVENIKAEIRA